MDLKTAKDMPPGSEVIRQGRKWTAAGDDIAERWEVTPQPNDWWGMQTTATDAEVDVWLAEGAQIIFIPAGYGRRKTNTDTKEG